MSISVLQRVSYAATGTHTPNITITPTGVGNKILFVVMSLSGTANPYIDGVVYSSLSGWTTIHGSGITTSYLYTTTSTAPFTVSFPDSTAPPLMRVYEFSPCEVDLYNTGSSTTGSGSISCTALTASGSAELFLNVVMRDVPVGGGDGLTSPGAAWTLDYTGVATANERLNGGVAIIASGSGTQQAIWSDSGASGFSAGWFTLALKTPSAPTSVSLTSRGTVDHISAAQDFPILYEYLSFPEFLERDPSTGAAWTPTGLSGTLFGAKFN
jgi:hypothetical protein